MSGEGNTAAAIPARLHVVLARRSPLAVVVRRGPTRHTAVFGWDRRDDSFRLGQWLYGRIYERRCDLSPDGRHFLYFAMNGRWDSAVGGSWSAISRAPWLKALTLHAKGDCWQGGGLFLDDRHYWLNGACMHRTVHDDSGLRRSADHPWPEAYGGECPGVYYIRLQRDGWALKYQAPDGAGGALAVFEKPAGGHWILRKLAGASLFRPAGRGVYFDRHELRNSRSGVSIELPDWEWAEVDGERLLWAAGGKLFAGRVDRGGLSAPCELRDFNADRFERRPAPY